MDLLNLKHLQQDSVQECEHDYHIGATSSGSSQYCPDCGSSHAVGFGRKRQLFMDAPVRGKRVGIWVDRRRLRCKQCGKSFMEPLPEMDDRRKAMRRLVQYIEREFLRRTFAGIAEDGASMKRASAASFAAASTGWSRKSGSRHRDGWGSTRSTSSRNHAA